MENAIRNWWRSHHQLQDLGEPRVGGYVKPCGFRSRPYSPMVQQTARSCTLTDTDVMWTGFDASKESKDGSRFQYGGILGFPVAAFHNRQ